MRKQRGFAAFAVAAALSLSMATPAFAATDILPSVGKTLELNEGSTVTATFKYTATPVALSTGNGSEKTYTDGPAVTIADITLTDATSTANNTGKGVITFDGAYDASAFPHAGVYAWKITENTGTYSGIGEMQYDPQVYTLIVTVGNGANGLKFSSIVIAKGAATSVTNPDKVDFDDIPFTNKYTERTDEQSTPTDLTITKRVTGNQGDKTKAFEFEVTFTAPSVLPSGKSAADVLNAITATANGATITEQGNTTGTARIFKFTAADAKSVTFSNILVGTTYAVSETPVAGYTQGWAAVSNGANVTAQTGVLVGEETNTATMTNSHIDITPTGLIMNNAPFIALGAVAVAGVVAYGAAKRKLEK